MLISIIILLIVVFIGLVLYLISKVKEEQKKPEPKQFSKEEIKKREGSYFNGREI